MDSRVKIVLHHHGDFKVHAFKGACGYIGGSTDFVEDVDTSKLRMLDLLKLIEKFGYSRYDFIYFQNDGHTFKKGVRLLYDAGTVKDMLKVCKPFNVINIYVDHKKRFETTDDPPSREKLLNFNVDDLNLEDGEIEGDDVGVEEEETEDIEEEGAGDGEEEEAGDGEEEEVGGGDLEQEEDLGYDDDSEDPDYEVGTHFESDDDDDSEADRHGGRDNFKMPNLDIDIGEEGFASDELRSENESSGDEYVKQGYVGVAPGKRTKKKHPRYNENREGPFTFEIGMKFSSMEEFRNVVRDYGIRERRSLHFIINDNDRVQVGCEKGCRFYIWCSKLRDGEAVQIRTLLDDHLCTKPYRNNLVSVKYLTEKYGDRIRQNPQWKVKDMMETIRDELEVEVPRIKCARVRKAARQHYNH